MQTVKNTIKLTLASSAMVLLTACGGGGDGGGGGTTSSVFQYIQANTFSGSTTVGLQINDDTQSYSSGCGISSPIGDQATTEARLATLGGTILTSTPTKWCATASGETGCYIQADKVYVIDSRNGLTTDIEIGMPGLVANRKTVVEYNSQNLDATIYTTTLDSTRTNALNCPAMATQSADAVDGNWSGYKATYDSNTKTAASVTASISCTNRVCTLSDAPTTTITLSQLNNGTWSTSANAPKYAGASISDDRQLLSVFVCSAPLIESQALASCGFYTFKR